jgi:leucyl aminopeptidase
MVIMRWDGGTPGEKPVAFVGKGVTFDTGGISIKPAAGMEDMKWDMAGAGAVTGLMAALAGRKAKVNAIGLVGLVENMPGGNAQRPGDVVKSYSGQTIEVLNTDAEGRLVLADVLWYCQEKFDPKFMIADMKNITGRPGGSITAAQFIARFINGKPWAHLDIAGMAWATKDAATVPKGATGYGVRLLDRLVADHFEA